MGKIFFIYTKEQKLYDALKLNHYTSDRMYISESDMTDLYLEILQMIIDKFCMMLTKIICFYCRSIHLYFTLRRHSESTNLLFV